MHVWVGLQLSSLQSEGMTADVQPNMQRYIEQLTNLVIQVLDGQDDGLRRECCGQGYGGEKDGKESDTKSTGEQPTKT